MSYHNVFRFEISVNNSKRMNISDSDKNLLKNVCSFDFSKKLRLFDKIKEIFAFH